MCESLETTSKGVDVLEKMDNFFNKIICPGIMWVVFAQTVPLLCSVPSQALQLW